MARRSSVRTLPLTIRHELTRKLRTSEYESYEGLSDWLSSSGFTISRSAIHRFDQKLRQTDNAAVAASLGTDLEDIRMRCIEAAALTKPDDVIAAAEAFFSWVLERD